MRMAKASRAEHPSPRGRRAIKRFEIQQMMMNLAFSSDCRCLGTVPTIIKLIKFYVSTTVRQHENLLHATAQARFASASKW
jgi:hypothetical protein